MSGVTFALAHGHEEDVHGAGAGQQASAGWLIFPSFHNIFAHVVAERVLRIRDLRVHTSQLPDGGGLADSRLATRGRFTAQGDQF